MNEPLRTAPDVWLCPIVEETLAQTEPRLYRTLPCLEALYNVTVMQDAEPRGLCKLHGVFRWGEVGGWIR